jgi:pimeloyl-ACP methyl ester carboxylesterase
VARVDPRFTPAHRGGSGEPLLLLHGFTDTWRTWELVLPALERRHDVLAPTLTGHAGGPPLPDGPPDDAVLDGIERALDEAGFATAHIAGNSLGGYLALRLAERGRARSVVALSPGGGWAPGDDSYLETLAHFDTMQEQLQRALPRMEAILATSDGRRRAAELMAERWEHIPPELLAHIWLGAALCPGMRTLNEHARRNGWPLDAERVTCPLRIVWGTADRLLPWPRAAGRYRALFPQADWVELDGVGHGPQLDVPLETAQLILGFTAP